MSQSIQDLAPAGLRAKAAERERWAAEARAARREEEAAVHERMRGMYLRRAEQMEGREEDSQ